MHQDLLPLNNQLESEEERIDALNALAWDMRNADSAQALILAEEAASLANPIDYKRGAAQSLRTIGYCNWRLSNNDDALERSQDALRLFESLNDEEGMLQALMNIGLVYDNLGEYAKSLLFHQQCLSLAQQQGDEGAEAQALNHTGSVHRNLGEYAHALELYHRSIGISQRGGDKKTEALALTHIGSVYEALGEYEKALLFHEQSLALEVKLKDKRGEASALENIGSVYENVGDLERALDCHKQSFEIRRGIGDQYGEAASLNHIGRVYESLGEYAKSMLFHQQALDLHQSLGDKFGEAQSLGNLGVVYQNLGDYRRSLDCHQGCLALMQLIGDRHGEAERLITLAQLRSRESLSEGDVDTAIESLRHALILTEDLGAKDLTYKTHFALALAHKHKADFERALYHHEQFYSVRQDVLGEEAARKLKQQEIRAAVAQSEKEKEIERLKNVELKAAFEKLAEQQERLNEQKNKLTEAYQLLEDAQQKSDALLVNILPDVIAERIKAGETTIADRFENVTVLFADIVGFTTLASASSPDKIVKMLGEVFSLFDDIGDKHGLEKIKTIGDAYMCVGGLPEPRNDHAEAVAEAALEMIEGLMMLDIAAQMRINIRIGIHSGEVVAGVIGKKKFVYDLWGDTVNTASRMESHGIAGQVQVSEATHALLKYKYLFGERASVEVKGKGLIDTYFLTGRKSKLMIV